MAQGLRIRLPMQGTRFDPWSGKISHAAEQLSLCATTTTHAPQQREATAMRSPRTATKNSRCSPQLEKAHAQQRRPNAAKK